MTLNKKDDWYKDLSPIEIRLYRTLYMKDLYSFVKEFWDTYESVPLVDGKLIQFYCEFYQYLVRNIVPTEVYEGPLDIPQQSDKINIIDVRQNKRNGCLNVPPSHSKSSVLNVAAAVWTILNNPIEIASVSHSENLSTEMNKKRQRILNSEKFRFFFPEIQLIENKGDRLVDSRHANLYSVNRNAFTGYHAMVIVGDDLTNARQAIKDKTELANAVGFYRDTLPSRLADPLSGVILNIQQRLSNSDITQNILNDEGLRSQYCFVVLPAEFEKETYVVCPITGTVFHFNEGDFLWSERFGDYSGLKQMVGPSVWATQYLQKPMSREDSIIKEDMIVEKDCTEVPGWDITNNCIDEMIVDRIYGSNDLPFKKNEKSDFLGHVLGYKVKKTLYIVDCVEEKQNFPDSVKFLKTLTLRYPTMFNIIEDKANGTAIMDALKDDIPGMLPFSPGLDSKEDRLNLSAPWLMSGNVVFVRTKFDEVNKKWVLTEHLQNLKQRLIDFPAVTKDDIVDGFSMLVLYNFNDSKYGVYNRSFNELNLFINAPEYDSSTIFFNREEDLWKMTEIGVIYGYETKLVVLREEQFVGDIESAMKKMKSFAPDKNVFIDCSMVESLSGVYSDDIIIEKYDADDFEKSVTDLNYAFAKNKILINESCKLIQTDIDNFKYSKKNPGKFISNKDGFVACLRIAMDYYGGIIY